jgi:uncharacterized GH25 family protein
MLRKSLLAMLVLSAAPMTASAHKMWLLPSETVLTGPNPVITVDAAISNDVFFFNHHALPLGGLTITAPDGSKIAPENQATLRYRSVFDVPLPQKGTYRIAALTSNILATWEEGGERKFYRGRKEDFASKVPAGASGLKVTEAVGRVETFVTNGPPTVDALKAVGEGIELIPVTHPNDLYSGESATFKLLVDGKPGAGLEVEIVRGGTRYRDAQEEIHAKADDQGVFSVQFEEAGMYWLEASTTDDKTSFPAAEGRSLRYSGTLEVLPR